MTQPKFDAMQYIWERLPKEKDGKHVRYIKGDIPYLYYYGFVDTRKFALKQWQAAFEPFRQPDGTFLVNQAQFMLLRVYRYNEPVQEPFDPKKLRLGPWPHKELQFLFEKTLKKCTVIPDNIFWNSITALKKRGKVNANNDLLIDEEVQKQFAYLIDRFPTPRRNLEKEVARLRQEKEKAQSVHQKNRDATVFTVGQSERDHKVDAFQKLQSSQSTPSPTRPAAPAPAAEPAGVDLKALRNSAPKPPGGKLVG
jgi:hypothetical protein